MYGPGTALPHMATDADNGTDVCRATADEIAVFEGIQRVLMDARKVGGRAGDILAIYIKNIPAKLLEAERPRVDTLLIGGHVL